MSELDFVLSTSQADLNIKVTPQQGYLFIYVVMLMSNYFVKASRHLSHKLAPLEVLVSHMGWSSSKVEKREKRAKKSFQTERKLI